MNKENIILVFAIIGSLIAYALFHTRELGVCNIYCGPGIDQYQDTFLFFPFILFFSLVTYKLPSIVFQTWWRFAGIAIPVILVLSFLINLELHHDPAGDMQDILDLPALVFLYSVFVLGSIIAIVRGYRKRV